MVLVSLLLRLIFSVSSFALTSIAPRVCTLSRYRVRPPIVAASRSSALIYLSLPRLSPPTLITVARTLVIVTAAAASLRGVLRANLTMHVDDDEGEEYRIDGKRKDEEEDRTSQCKTEHDDDVDYHHERTISMS